MERDRPAARGKAGGGRPPCLPPAREEARAAHMEAAPGGARDLLRASPLLLRGPRGFGGARGAARGNGAWRDRAATGRGSAGEIGGA